MIDYQAHWQAIYNEMRTALDTATRTDVDIYHVFTGDTTLIKSGEPPLLVYRQDVERNLGTVGDGALKVLRSNWILTAYSDTLGDALDIASVVLDALVENPFTTTDGYTTTHVEPLGVQSLYEQDSKLWAVHLRVLWERSM